MFIKLYRSLVYNYKQTGISGIIKKLFMKFCGLFYFKNEWLIYKKCFNETIRCPTSEDIEIKLLSFDDLISSNFFKAIAYPEIIKIRYKEGALCYGIFYKNKLAHIAWTTEGYLFLDDKIPSILSTDCLGIFDCYTLPDYRNKGIYQFVLFHLLWISSIKKKNSWIAVAEHNIFSRKAIEKNGFILEAKAIYLRVLFFKKFFLVNLKHNSG